MTLAGYMPQTIEEITETCNNFNNLRLALDGKPQLDLTEFIGSNAHKVAQTAIYLTAQYQAEFLNALNAQMQFLYNEKFKIESASGPTLDGLYKIVEKTAPGLQFSCRYNASGTGPDAYIGGSVTIAFDNPPWNADDTSAAQAIEIFKTAMPLGTIAVVKTTVTDKIKTVKVPIGVNGQNITYKYRVLKPSEYVKMQLKIDIQLKRSIQEGQLQISPTQAVLTQDIQKKFDSSIIIGADFDPDALLDPSDYPGVADFIVKSKIVGDTDYVAGRRAITEPDFCQKFSLESVVIGDIS